MTLLRVENMTASYGSAQTLQGVNLSIGAGEVVALMGRNGVGKTTTVRAISRMIASDGTLEFAGTTLHGLPSHSVAKLGLGLVPEGRRCFRDLTVRENLVAASRPGPWTLDTVTDLFPRLQERSGQRAASLSGGEQQMLAIARALMTNPRLLVLDEATEGLAPLVRAEIWNVIEELKRDTGLAILVIDKSVKELSRVSDRAVVLERGATVWEGTMRDLTPAVTERYIGI